MLLGHPCIAGFHLYDRSWKKGSKLHRFAQETKLLRQIRQSRYDLVINLTEGDRGAIAAKISGAKKKIGVDPGPKLTRKWYTDLIKPCPTPRHAVERDLDALRKLGINPALRDRDLFWYVSDDDRQAMQEKVGDEPYIVMQGAARWRFKCPPPELMARVCDRLNQRVILTGAPSEREFVQQIADQSRGNVVNLAGETTLKEMGALLLGSEGLITVDSVALHMASALKVPVVALFGPTSERKWGPWMHPKSAVVAKNYPCRPCGLDGCGGSKISDCLLTLSVEEIIKALYRVTSAGVEEACSAASLAVLNSFDINRTE